MKRHPIRTKTKSRRFGGFRALGGSVQPDKSYVVGESGPETFVPATPNENVLAVGGLGSTKDDNFIKTVRVGAPNAKYIWLRGSGGGIAGTGIANSENAIAKAFEATGTNKTTVPAYSLGASLVFNELKKNPRENIHPIYVDPASNPSWLNAPFGGIIPTARAMTKAARMGIGNDPNTISWTDGKSITYGPWGGAVEKHGPWNYPGYPGSDVKTNQLINLLRSQQTVGTNGPTVFNPKTPGTILPNEFAPILDDFQ